MTYEVLQEQAKQKQTQFLRQRIAGFTQQLQNAVGSSRTQTYLERAQLYTQLGEYDNASQDYQMAVDAFLQVDVAQVA